MKTDARLVLDLIQSARAHAQRLCKETEQHDTQDWVYARVDLGHADYALGRAETFIERVLLNEVAR